MWSSCRSRNHYNFTTGNIQALFSFAVQARKKESLIRIAVSISMTLCTSVSVCLSLSVHCHTVFLLKYRNIFTYTDFVQFVGQTIYYDIIYKHLTSKCLAYVHRHMGIRSRPTRLCVLQWYVSSTSVSTGPEFYELGIFSEWL